MTTEQQRRERWEGDMEARIRYAERRLDVINGHLDALRKTVNRWAGAIAVLVLLANVLAVYLVAHQ